MIFFVTQKTVYELRISDWSSNVCSSYLPARCFRMMLVVGRQRLAELLEQFFLRLGQPYRRFDEYRAVQVARAGGTYRAYATTAQAELLAALRAFRHVDLDLAFKCRHFKLATARCGHDRNRHRAMTIARKRVV